MKRFFSSTHYSYIKKFLRNQTGAQRKNRVKRKRKRNAMINEKNKMEEVVTNFLEAEKLMDEANLEAILYMACLFRRNYFTHTHTHTTLQIQNGFLLLMLQLQLLGLPSKNSRILVGFRLSVPDTGLGHSLSFFALLKNVIGIVGPGLLLVSRVLSYLKFSRSRKEK